ncbi:MAG: pro-sigmaK processing inhibitor BofA family protein [Methanomicrobiales archaeon]|jgi:hypothetical protein|nr:pro-sigmaK processing inhibitor BofA family protein [Methanomicrobiales archaeon]
MTVDITVLIIIVAILLLLPKLIRFMGRVVINSFLGFVFLFVSNALGITTIQVNVISLLICAVGGIPGALILIALNLLGIY